MPADCLGLSVSLWPFRKGEAISHFFGNFAPEIASSPRLLAMTVGAPRLGKEVNLDSMVTHTFSIEDYRMIIEVNLNKGRYKAVKTAITLVS